MKIRTIRALALLALLTGSAVLAIVAVPRPLEAQACTPMKEIREVPMGETGSCCSENPPGRKHFYWKEVRYQNPDCTWTRWYTMERVTKCMYDWTCSAVSA